MRPWRAALIPWLIFAAGCSDGTGPEDNGPPGLHALAGQSGDDSIYTTLPHALVVELRDADGKPVPGVVVRFEPESIGVRKPFVELARLSSASFSGLRVDTTDARGRVAMVVRLGPWSGAAGLRISAPTLGLQTRAAYVIRPGAPAAVTVEPADTALYVGKSFALRGTVRDQLGNVRPESLTYTAVGTGNAVSATDGTVRGERIGRGYAVARFGTIADTTWVSVVPNGLIAAYEPPAWIISNGVNVRRPPRIVLFELDGSEFRVLLDADPPESGIGSGMLPRWAPSGNEIAYVQHGELWAADITGAKTRIHAGHPRVADNHSPEYSPDGQWIYFTQTTDSTGIWRARRDGSGVVRTAAEWPQAASPSPAPSGGRFVYHKPGPQLRILIEATGEQVELPVFGQWPRWSPTGEWIAYLNRELRLLVTRPDGSDRRLVGNGITAQANFSWSPDGRWLLYSASQYTPSDEFRVGLHLVDVETGEVLPLRFGRTLVQGSWRR